ncbi:MAG: N-acetylmuramoyl-L-alanine amidase [Ferruginibacter sp.]
MFKTHLHKYLFGCFFVAILASCATSNPYSKTNKISEERNKDLVRQISGHAADTVKADSIKKPVSLAFTTNFNLRKPNYVIIHHTAQNSCEKTVQTFTADSTEVSAHYVICKDGTLHHMLNDYLRAWHAGASKWGNNTDMNSVSIGIELDNSGVDTFTIAQLNVLEALLIKLKMEYNIPAANFIGHADVAPTRKTDPNVYFPWKYFAERGFGLWYDDTANIKLPQGFNPVLALKIIGYDVKNTDAAIEAFRRHFLAKETKGTLSNGEKKVLYAIMQKCLQ